MAAPGPETSGLAKPARRPLRRLMRGAVLLALAILAVLGGGFVWFVWHVPATEVALNHVSGFRSGVAGVYNRAQLEPQIRHALNVWDAHVREIVEGRVGGDLCQV